MAWRRPDFTMEATVAANAAETANVPATGQAYPIPGFPEWSESRIYGDLMGPRWLGTAVIPLSHHCRGTVAPHRHPPPRIGLRRPHGTSHVRRRKAVAPSVPVVR